jgi:chorismate synthase
LDDPAAPKVTCPRPGHADLAGALKYGHDDIRSVIERASARETVMKVATGAVFKLMLREFGMRFYSHTIAIGGLAIRNRELRLGKAERSPLRCLDPVVEKSMLKLIDRAARKGDSLGGVTEIVAANICPGLGSYVQSDRRIDALIGMAMMSIPSVKGVEIGTAFANASLSGYAVHDEIFYGKTKGYFRKTNRSGGIEGGMTNGEHVIVRLALKPIPSITRPLHTVNMATKRNAIAHKERADVCVVPAAGVIGEAILAHAIIGAFLEKFGNDTMSDIQAAYRCYMRRIKNG